MNIKYLLALLIAFMLISLSYAFAGDDLACQPSNEVADEEWQYEEEMEEIFGEWYEAEEAGEWHEAEEADYEQLVNWYYEANPEAEPGEYEALLRQEKQIANYIATELPEKLLASNDSNDWTVLAFLKSNWWEDEQNPDSLDLIEKTWEVEPNHLMASWLAFTFCHYNESWNKKGCKTEIPDKLLQIDPNNAFMIIYVASYYYENGEVEKAYELIQSLNSNFAFNLTLFEIRGLIYERLKFYLLDVPSDLPSSLNEYLVTTFAMVNSSTNYFPSMRGLIDMCQPENLRNRTDNDIYSCVKLSQLMISEKTTLFDYIVGKAVLSGLIEGFDFLSNNQLLLEKIKQAEKLLTTTMDVVFNHPNFENIEFQKQFFTDIVKMGEIAAYRKAYEKLELE